MLSLLLPARSLLTRLCQVFAGRTPTDALPAAPTALQLAMFQHERSALVVLNPQGLVLAMNPAAERMMDLCSGEVTGRCTLASWLDDADRHTVSSMVGQLLKTAGHAGPVGPSLEQPVHWQRRDGHRIPVALTLVPLREAPAIGGLNSGKLTGFLALARHTSERQHTPEQLSQLAYHDSLTGLPNRSTLMHRLALAIDHAERTQRPLALLFIDLDRFKPINDNHGHAVGDQVLCEVGRRLQGALRQHDLVARLGGDEFVVLLSTLARLEDAPVVADKLQASLAEPVLVGPLQLPVAASIGLAAYPQAGTDPASLLRAADLAMYQAKRDRSAAPSGHSVPSSSPAACVP